VGELIYSAIASLDGYVADADGKWDWSVPDEDVHAAVNDLERTIGTHLLGRRMYEVLVVWETMDVTGEPPVMHDFQQGWLAADKIVYSRTLEEVASTRTRIEREFDPEAVRRMKAETEHALGVGGPELAAHALRAGLVDDIHLFLSPVVVGGGTPALPDGLRLDLSLAGEQRFGNGVVHLHYRAAHASSS
jgi:dihydrofolate reductase